LIAKLWLIVLLTFAFYGWWFVAYDIQVGRWYSSPLDSRTTLVYMLPLAVTYTVWFIVKVRSSGNSD